jgi:hypothetical protein
VVLSDEFAERRRRDVSTASITCEAIERYVCDVQDDAFGFTGMVCSGGVSADASDDEAYLVAYWADDIAADEGDVLPPPRHGRTDETIVSTNA